MKALYEEILLSYYLSSSLDQRSYSKILEYELKNLNSIERKAIYLRFWVPCSIAEIAAELKLSWDSADNILETAITKIRDGFKKHYTHDNFP